MKKYISVILAMIILATPLGAFAKPTDLPMDSIYKAAVNNVVQLGIMSEISKGVFKPNTVVTREEFAKVLITAAGLNDSAKALAGTTSFSDVKKTDTYSGYINFAVSKGYLSGMADGKFHPRDKVTFAQACTAAVRALGYTDQDVTGIWPRNYTDKAKMLRIVDGINLGNNDGLPRWAAALIIDRLLDTNVKKSGTTDQTFADSTGRYLKCIILANSKILSKLSSNQVLTDKGIYYVSGADVSLKLGGQYRVVIDDDSITNATDNLRTETDITVKSAVNTTITYSAKGTDKTMDLPDKTVYYYQGEKIAYDSIKGMLQTNTAFIFIKNTSGTGYEYAIIIDPVYSKPEVASNGSISANKIGGIDFSNNPHINKNGQLISFSQIETGDVVYQVSDIWNNNRYILVLDNTVQGKITNILPNKLSPKTIQIDNTNYDLSADLNYSKIGNATGAFKVGDSVTLLLGSDGKVADIVYTDSYDNSSYAVVLNTTTTVSTDLEDRGKMIYNVKMLLADGSTKTYKLDNVKKLLADGSIGTYKKEEELNAVKGDIKGKLIRFNYIDDETVAIEAFNYSTDKSYTLDRDERRIDSGFAADNIKIFDLISNDGNNDAVAKLVNWSDMPNGTVPSGKIKFINKNGSFDDINVMFVDNILNEGYYMGVVKQIIIKGTGSSSSYTYTLLIDNKEYTCNTYMKDVYLGAVIKVRLVNNSVYYTYDVRNPVVETAAIQAIDTKRIKINNSVYVFDNDIAIYYKDSNNVYTQKGVNDIQPGTTYGKISVYLETPYNTSKVKVIIVQP